MVPPFGGGVEPDEVVVAPMTNVLLCFTRMGLGGGLGALFFCWMETVNEWK
jgi:hypothetical protein